MQVLNTVFSPIPQMVTKNINTIRDNGKNLLNAEVRIDAAKKVAFAVASLFVVMGAAYVAVKFAPVTFTVIVKSVLSTLAASGTLAFTIFKIVAFVDVVKAMVNKINGQNPLKGTVTLYILKNLPKN